MANEGQGERGGRTGCRAGKGEGERAWEAGREAKYEVRGTKYEVEIRRNSVARGVEAKPGNGGQLEGRRRCRAGKGGKNEVLGGEEGRENGRGRRGNSQVRGTKYEVEKLGATELRRVRWKEQSRNDA